MAIAEPTASVPSEPVRSEDQPIAETSAAVVAPPVASADGPVVLEVEDLHTQFFTYDGVVRALEGVTFSLRRGETMGLVGETGCGKSVTAFSITRLIPDPPGRIVSGRVVFREANLLWGIDREARYRPIPGTKRVKVSRRFRRIRAATERMSAVRGRGISMIFQEPTQAMNPVFSIADQMGEVLLIHRGVEILRDMLSATPEAPEIPAAIDEVVKARGRRVATREAADHLGAVTHSPRLATEAYYLGRTRGSPEARRTELEHAVRRLRLTRIQRSYLAHRRRLLEMDDELRAIYLREMREGKLQAAQRRLNRARRLSQRLRYAHFRLWGLRRWVNAPLRQELFWRAVRLLEGVSIANPVVVARGYPHELSGGMLQRVMIAIALSSDPDILLADEPTTALDVTIQAQILELMRELKARVGTAILLITHDLAVVAEVADRVSVMYAGQIVEQARVRDLFRQPLHPYTQGLLASIPRLDQPEKELKSIPGSVPGLIDPPTGCRFHPRCPHAMPICRDARPPMTLEGPDHTVACYLFKGPSVRG